MQNVGSCQPGSTEKSAWFEPQPEPIAGQFFVFSNRRSLFISLFGRKENDSGKVTDALVNRGLKGKSVMFGRRFDVEGAVRRTE